MSEGGREVVEKRGWRRCLEGVSDWFKYKDKGEWLNEMKGGISIVASLIATMAFQLATNPPGGVVQTSIDDKGFMTNCSPTKYCDYCSPIACPGDSVMAIVDPNGYKQFLIWNAVSFVASNSVCLMLVSGIPLNHRFPTWLLSIGMCIAITAFGVTYMLATNVVTPETGWNTFYKEFKICKIVWRSLLGIVSLFLIIRLLVWCVSKRSTK